MTERQAMPGDVLLRDYAYSTYFYRAKTNEGETVDAVQEASFWAHMAKKFRIGDKVEVLADDGTWEWHGRVQRKGAVEVFFREIFVWQSDGQEARPAPTPEYKVAWAGNSHKFRIINDAGDILKHGFEDKEQAIQYLSDYKSGRIPAVAA